jgi:hypothetical protein
MVTPWNANFSFETAGAAQFMPHFMTISPLCWRRARNAKGKLLRWRVGGPHACALHPQIAHFVDFRRPSAVPAVRSPSCPSETVAPDDA